MPFVFCISFFLWLVGWLRCNRQVSCCCAAFDVCLMIDGKLTSCTAFLVSYEQLESEISGKFLGIFPETATRTKSSCWGWRKKFGAMPWFYLFF